MDNIIGIAGLILLTMLFTTMIMNERDIKLNHSNLKNVIERIEKDCAHPLYDLNEFYYNESDNVFKYTCKDGTKISVTML